MSGTADNTTYFIVKCRSLESLQTCIKTEMWAFRERANPPQPQDLLTAAHRTGRVILIFSVNNQHGWHGFCESLYLSKKITPSLEQEEVEVGEKSGELTIGATSYSSSDKTIDDAEDSLNGAGNSSLMPWQHFPVKWLTNFHLFDSQTCLSFKQTQHLTSCDGNPVNKARNWERLSQSVGDELCDLIEKYREKLTLDRARVEKEKLAQREESFFKNQTSLISSEKKEGWAAVIEKAERDLGQLHLVCPFGSQRYNCSLPESDNDIFIVYQARTTQMLGLDPPKQTIKNSEKEVVDYTILELQRYCELLVAGDSKCIETLFLLDTKVLAVASPEWKLLCDVKQHLLTKSCFDKYMHEAEGTRGLKQFYKWQNNNPQSEQLPPKLNKLSYIVLRLLQNARDLVVTNDLKVYRDIDSPERQELLAVRQGSYTFSGVMELCNRYLTEINDHKSSLHNDGKQAKDIIQSWLLDRRMQDLQNHPHGQT